MKDIQNHQDDRNIDIDQVGVKGIHYPITVLDKTLGKQQTIAKINMYVNLPRYYKGTHMSRFVEILNEHSNLISLQNFSEILEEMKKRLDAESAHMEISFPYFIKKMAPVTESEGLMEYNCTFKGSLNKGSDLMTIIHVPISTLCPCSKEISDFGAHNQRDRSRKICIVEHRLGTVVRAKKPDASRLQQTQCTRQVLYHDQRHPLGRPASDLAHRWGEPGGAIAGILPPLAAATVASWPIVRVVPAPKVSGRTT